MAELGAATEDAPSEAEFSPKYPLEPPQRSGPRQPGERALAPPPQSIRNPVPPAKKEHQPLPFDPVLSRRRLAACPRFAHVNGAIKGHDVRPNRAYGEGDDSPH
jgi:hypothetical protein